MPIQQTAGFTDDAEVHCAHILSLGWQTHQASVETASMSIGKNVLTGPQQSTHPNSLYQPSTDTSTSTR